MPPPPLPTQSWQPASTAQQAPAYQPQQPQQPAAARNTGAVSNHTVTAESDGWDDEWDDDDDDNSSNADAQVTFCGFVPPPPTSVGREGAL